MFMHSNLLPSRELRALSERTPDELVAILLSRLRDATSATSEAAAQLVTACGGASGLSRLDAGDMQARLTALRIGRAAEAARVLAAAFELGRRVVLEDARIPQCVRNSEDAASWAIPRIGPLPHEELWMLALDGRARLRAVRLVAKGGLHGVGLRAADPIRFALRADATSFILIHNHPSGDVTPSKEDIAFTSAIARAAAVVGVPLLDHLVVTRDSFAVVPIVTEAEKE